PFSARRFRGFSHRNGRRIRTTRRNRPTLPAPAGTPLEKPHHIHSDQCLQRLRSRRRRALRRAAPGPASNAHPAGRNRPASPVSPHRKGRHPPPTAFPPRKRMRTALFSGPLPCPQEKKGGGLRRPARLPTRKGAPCPRTPPPAPAGRPRPGWAPWPWAPPSPPPPPPPPTSTPPRSG